MAELEFGGVTMKGGKMFAVVTALTTLTGALYGTFEIYKDYMDMKEQIQSYVAPDMSGIEQELAVQREAMIALEKAIDTCVTQLEGLQEELRADLDRVEDLSRKVDDTTAETQRELRDDVYTIEQKVNDRLRVIDNDIRTVRKELEEKIQLILDNPLNN